MVDRSEVVSALKRVLIDDAVLDDHTLIINLMGACAYLFAYPAAGDDHDTLTLQLAYMQLKDKGHL